MLLGRAMVLYPGGNWLDRSAAGHRFFRNFLCDLTQPVSLSGVPNPDGSRQAQWGMLLFAGALAGVFWVAPHLFRSGQRPRLWARGSGACAALSFMAVPLTPSERFGNVHAALALLSGGFGVTALLCAVWGLFAARGRARALALLGCLALALGVVDGALFIAHLGQVAPPPYLVPALQKVAALVLGAWLVAVALAVVFDHDLPARMNAGKRKEP